MTRPSQPLLFLAAVIGLWTGGRIIALAPDWSSEEPRLPPSAQRAAAPVPQQAHRPTPDAYVAPPSAYVPMLPRERPPRRTAHLIAIPYRLPSALAHFSAPRSAMTHPPVPAAASPPRSFAPALPPTLVPPPALMTATVSPLPPPPRLGASAFLFVRDDIDGSALAPGGTLGGSQAGARLTYRLNRDASRPLALSARAYLPLARPGGAEAAVGLDWRPIAALPVNLLVERRQAIGREGRSDFSLTLYGGVDRPIARDRLRLEAYGQAGIVGTSDLFADGAARLTARAGPLRVGAGAWGGAQPGVERLDIGPHASARLPVGRTAVAVAAEWRFRIAGDAAPASGPALTVSTGF